MAAISVRHRLHFTCIRFDSLSFMGHRAVDPVLYVHLQLYPHSIGFLLIAAADLPSMLPVIYHSPGTCQVSRHFFLLSGNSFIFY